MKKLILVLFAICLVGWSNAQPLKMEQKGKQLLLHISDSLLGKEMLFSSKVMELSAQKNIAAGQSFLDPYIFWFERNRDNIVLKKVITKNSAILGSHVAEAISKNNVTPVIMSFPLEKSDGKGFVTINLAEWLNNLSVHNDPLPNGAASGGMIAAISGVNKIINRDDRVNIIGEYHFKGAREPFSAKIAFTIRVAPQAMTPRENDLRVGYFSTQKVLYSDGDVKKISYATRWRIEPKEEDLEAYKRGKMVEPAKKIVFAFDPATPTLVKKYATMGILDWNKAFAKIGFKNVIEVRELTKADSLLEDTNINLFRYIPTDSENAQGLAWTDPRSGEVIQAEILWYHNVVNLLKTWRFIQTAAADKRVRNFNEMSDEVVGEMIRYAVAHEMGHVLGLTHNMRASAGRTIKELREGNAKVGTTASIMDYARFNYVAAEGSAGRGVAMLPPTLGEYDFYAIEWGYKQFYGKDTRKLLNEMIVNKSGIEQYKFSKGTTRQVVTDPLTVTNTLGDDLVQSSKYGIENLAIIRKGLLKWNVKQGDDYSVISHLYTKLIDQYFMYVSSTLSYIGGVYSLEGVAGEHKYLYENVSKEKQYEALDFAVNALINKVDVLYDAEIYSFIGNQNSYIMNKQRNLIGIMMSANFLEQVEGGIGVESYLQKLSDALFSCEENRFTKNLRILYLKELKSKLAGGDAISFAAVNEIERIKNRIPTNYKLILN